MTKIDPNKANADNHYILSIDNGTQSIRAIIFDAHGQVIVKNKVNIEAYFSKEPTWAEQHPEYYWKKLCEACLGLWKKTSLPKSAIKAVALTTQRNTVINLDRNGEPLRPAIVWLDQREEHDFDKMGMGWRSLFALVGETKNVHYFRSKAQANWIAKNQPELWNKTHKYLLLSGYHTFKLTGLYVDSVSSQVGYLPFDFKKQQWCNKQDWQWNALPIKPEMLPKLIPCGEPLGSISENAAQETGIPEGLPLISAGADKACEVLGSACLTPEVGSLSYGTTATFNTTNKKYVEAIKRMPAYPAAMPNSYNTEMIVQRGYWMVSWFKREFGLREQQLAEQRGIATELLFNDLLKQVPPGSMGLTLQPYWSPGVKQPGPEAKGAMIGFGDVHTRAHIYRAIIEGLTYALREGKELSEKKSGVKISRLKVSGGGSQSDQVMQITADIFGMTVERPHTYETSALGAAINAAVGVGIYPDHKTAVSQMTHAGDSFEPNVQNHEIYDQLYHHVYKKMYSRLQPIYRAIRRITGYPS